MLVEARQLADLRSSLPKSLSDHTRSEAYRSSPQRSLSDRTRSVLTLVYSSARSSLPRSLSDRTAATGPRLTTWPADQVYPDLYLIAPPSSAPTSLTAQADQVYPDLYPIAPAGDRSRHLAYRSSLPRSLSDRTMARRAARLSFCADQVYPDLYPITSASGSLPVARQRPIKST